MVLNSATGKAFHAPSERAFGRLAKSALDFCSKVTTLWIYED
jgi:hypothetical protein